MNNASTSFRRALAAALAVVGLAAGAASAHPDVAPYVPPPFVKSSLVQVDVYDRVNGSALPVYAKDGRNHVVGVPGHEYAVRIRNTTSGRVLVVTSVDGVNVITGDTAAPSQSGYVLDPWGSVEVGGWRKSLSRTAAFYFTDLGDSYAARTGRPQNVGVIGVAVFQERPKRVALPQYDYRGRASKDAAAESSGNVERAEAPSSSARAAPPAAAAEGAPAAEPRQPLADEMKSMGKLGTGHGRSEESNVTLTQFDRATSYPAETVSIQYDRRENLVAMGVIPQPTPYIARREPNPFPGMRFAPDP
ncbi:MAG TPA: hypothetical protein VMN56_14530 [Casimicrobiaceae bacterium]|nr:hypothetical protein [Casimicrobiaceae bacterium]